MPAKIIDGKVIAEEVRNQVQKDVQGIIEKGLRRPALATVLVGDNPASHIYVSSKHKACQLIGIESIGHELPAGATQDQVIELVQIIE